MLLNTTSAGASTPTFAAPQVIPVGADPESLIAVDVNGDGKPDLAVANYSDSTITVLINATTAGASTVDFSNQQAFAIDMPAFQVAAADINGDGLPDLVGVDFGNGSITVLLNTTTVGATTPSFAAPQDFAAGGTGDTLSLVATDLNGDGVADVAVVDMATNQVLVLVNTTVAGSSTVSFAASQSFATGNYPEQMMSMDVDLDGKPDLVMADSMGNTLSVLHNTTTAGSATVSFDPHMEFAVGTNPVEAAAADLNGDGKLDVIATNASDNTVSVLLNTTP